MLWNTSLRRNDNIDANVVYSLYGAQRKIFNKKATNQTLVTVTESHYNEALLQHNNDINRNYAKNNFIDTESMTIPEDGRINYSTNRAQVHHGSKHIVKMLGKLHKIFFIIHKSERDAEWANKSDGWAFLYTFHWGISPNYVMVHIKKKLTLN